MKYLLPTIVLLTLLGCSARFKTKVNHTTKEKERTGALEAMKRDFEMMKDPSLGYVPSDRLLEAKAYKDRLVATQTEAALSGVQWRFIGPTNQGGRTKTILTDANDPTGNTVFAGSVSGGLWRTTNFSSSTPDWVPVNDFLGNLAITSIAQDPTNAQIMYLGTGEGANTFDRVQGMGIWKSTNGGASWTQLSSTNNSNFYFNQKILVTGTGVLFAATSSGLRRSTDGGNSFSKVLGTGLGITGASSDYCDDLEIAADGTVFAALSGSIHKSTNGGVSFSAAQSLPVTGAGRIELACAPSDFNYVYAVVEKSDKIEAILRTTDGGTTWLTRTEPTDAGSDVPADDFSRSQAWYDLALAVDPTNKDRVFTGAINLFVSNDGAGTWTQISQWYGLTGYQYIHSDHHLIMYKPGSSAEIYFTNDGGIFHTTNAAAAVPVISDKSADYATAQFYSCAMHPASSTNHFLAGAQDNGTHMFKSGNRQNSIEIVSGDGGFCHIDQDQPQYQFAAYTYNDYYRSTDGGNSWESITHSADKGLFINPTDYDDANNRLYACRDKNQYVRWDDPQTGTTFTTIPVPTFNGKVSAVKVSPNVSNRVFFGIDNGTLFRVNNAHSASPSPIKISTGLPAAYLSCIEVETGNDNHLLVAYSNYGVNSIWESKNAGATWTSVEGNLPDMPVRWIMLNPNNSDQAIIATELGVWSTDDLNGASTVWGASNSGLANVRVDMLQIRTSDNLVLAATHGRGLFTSDIFTTPTALFEADTKTTYIGRSINFTSTSYKATSWAWDFGDGTSSSAENPAKTFSSPGKYNVTLTINTGASTITKNSYIHILPNRGTPYSIADGGGFELNTDDFGVEQVSGSSTWERGNSTVTGKSGVHNGANAWVTGLTETTYSNYTETNLMSPNYNFTLPGTYTLSFWSKYNSEAGSDGFRVEYTLDKGITWTALGTSTATNWYDFENANTASNAYSAVFPINEAFFSSNSSDAFTQRIKDISFLAGNPSVGFRVTFRSDPYAGAAGAAIDDWEISGPVNYTLPLNLYRFTAFKNNADIMLKWSTTNEQNVSRFIVERSTDGVNFSAIGTVAAHNQPQNEYSYPDLISRMPARPAGYLLYRLKMVDVDEHYRYSSIARITVDANAGITIGPNPFVDQLNIYSPAEIKNVILADFTGRTVFQTSSVIGTRINLPHHLPAGQYLLSIVTAKEVITKKVLKK